MFKRTLISLVVAGLLLTPLAAGITSADSSSSTTPTWSCTKLVTVDAANGRVMVLRGEAENGKEKAALEKKGYECTKSQQAAAASLPEPTPSVPEPTPIHGHRGRGRN
jgi:hypothetical protein